MQIESLKCLFLFAYLQHFCQIAKVQNGSNMWYGDMLIFLTNHLEQNILTFILVEMIWEEPGYRVSTSRDYFKRKYDNVHVVGEIITLWSIDQILIGNSFEIGFHLDLVSS